MRRVNEIILIVEMNQLHRNGILLVFDVLCDITYVLKRLAVALGGLVVSVLATGPKVRGFKPGRGRWILRVIKSIARLPSEGK
jgi:hypothetical protein